MRAALASSAEDLSSQDRMRKSIEAATGDGIAGEQVASSTSESGKEEDARGVHSNRSSSGSGSTSGSGARRRRSRVFVGGGGGLRGPPDVALVAAAPPWHGDLESVVNEVMGGALLGTPFKTRRLQRTVFVVVANPKQAHVFLW